MQPSAEELSKLLLTLYAAPMRPELWATFLKEFTALLGLPAAAILHQDLARQKYAFGVSSGMDPESLRQYDRYYGQIDPWRPKFLTKHEGELAFGEDLCPSSVLRKTEFYNDCQSKTDVNLYCSVATVKQPKSFELISIYHGLHAAPPGNETLATVELLIPHIRAALRLRHQLCEIDISLLNHADTLHALSVGVILLNQQGECVFVSRKAEDVCIANDGIFIKNSRICAAAPEDHQALHILIARAIALAGGTLSQPCGAVSISRRYGAPLKVSATSLSNLVPLGQLELSRRATAALFIRHPGNDAVSLAHILTATYALTGAETGLAVKLFEGSSLAQAAAQRGVSLETVRIQLKAVFTKTATHRQSELVSLLSRLIAN